MSRAEREKRAEKRVFLSGRRRHTISKRDWSSDVCSSDLLKPGERFTFEYVMLDGVNDSDEHARQLANLLNRHQLRAKINLIPHNPAEPLSYQPSSASRIESFREILEAKGIHGFVRRPRGRDILAACGQLAARDSSSSLGGSQVADDWHSRSFRR